MKAIYTEAAKIELDAFQTRQQEMLESIVAERKLVLGDDVLEITASDIMAASEKIQIYRPTFRQNQSTVIVTRAYIFIGISMMVGAFFYPQLMEIYATNKNQVFIFFVGATMAAVGWLFNNLVQARQKRMAGEIEVYFASMRRKKKQGGAKSSSEDQSEI